MLDGPAAEAKPKNLSVSLAHGKKATASNVWHNAAAQFGPQMAFDDNAETRWATDEATRQAWLEVDLGSPQKIDHALVMEEFAGRVRRFELQVNDGTAWKTVVQGTTLDTERTLRFPPVVAQKVRLNILEASEGPSIAELRVFSAN
jgi:alpha-L-fucosidase